MRITVEVSDQLLDRARLFAQRNGITLSALVEQGLRQVLSEPCACNTYQLEDCRVGNPQAENPLTHLPWTELRNEIYGHNS